MKTLYICACLALTTGCVEDTSEQSQASTTSQGGSGSGHICRPPQEALDACDDLAAGAACSFDAPDGHQVDGTCRNGPDGQGPLACAPKMRLPPPEAIDACATSTAGADCAFTVDGHDVTGTCKAGPDVNGPLACAPDQPPPPPGA